MTQPIQFGIRIDVDRRQAKTELDQFGDDVTNTSNRVAQAGQNMAAGLTAGIAAVSSTAQSVNALGETEAQATERIRSMVAASLAQTTALAESAAATDAAATATRRYNTENTDLAATLARQNTQMARSTTVAPVQAQSTEESEKYVASLRRQAETVGLNAAEQAKLETKLRGGTAALQAQAYAVVDNAQALREQIAAEQKSSQAADAFIAKLKDQVDTLGMSRTQLLAHRAAQLGVADAAAPMIAKLNEAGTSAKTAGGHTEGFSFKTAAAKREVLVLAHELSQGNFQRFGGSMMVLGEQTGAAGLLFSSAGLAALALTGAVVGIGYAMIKGAADQKHMEDALIMTGNYAGATSDKLNDLAHQAVETGGSIGEAKKIVTELAASGKVSAEQIGTITQATVAWEHATGQSAKSIIKDFQTLEVQTSGSSARSTEAVSRAVLKLDDSYHFLTEAVYEQILALEKEGDAKGASALATDTFAHVTKERAEEITQNLGSVARAWNGIKEAAGAAVDAINQAGTRATPASDVKKASFKLKSFDEGLADSNKRLGRAPDAMSADLEATRMKLVRELTEAVTRLNQADADAIAQGKARIAESEANHAASRVIEDDRKLQKKGLSELHVQLEQYREDIAKIKAVNPDSILVKPEAVAAHIAAITKAHTEKDKGNDDRAKVLQGALLQEQTALDREKNIYDERDKMLALYHSKFGLSDAEFYVGREAARTEYIASEAAAFAREADLIKNSKANTPVEIAANKEKYDALLRQHLQFLDKMRAQRAEDGVNETAEAKKRYDDVIKAIQANGTAEVQNLDDAIAKQKEHNAEIGKTKEQIELARKAVVDQQTAQMESDAEFLRNALEKENFDAEARVAYGMRLEFLDREIAKRRELATIMASGAVLEANATAAKKAAESWESSAKTISTTLADAIANGGGNAWKKLKAAIVSQALNVPINMIASAGATFMNPNAPQANGAGQAAAYMGGQNPYGNILNNAGGALLSIGNWTGSSSVAAFGNGMQLGNNASGAIQAYNAAGYTDIANSMQAGSTFGSYVPVVGGALSAYSVAQQHGAVAGGLAGAGSIAATGALGGAMAGTGMMAGATAALAAIPVWGWAALAVASILGGMDDGPEKDTHLKFTSNNTPGNISINERGNEGKTGQSYIDDFGTSAFGTFGVASSFWMSSSQPAVQQFIQTVSKTDDILSTFLTGTEQASVKSSLTGKDYTAHTGAEGENPNGKGQLDEVFKERLTNIFEAVQPGLSGLIKDFNGTSQELATEAAALLKYRQALTDQGEALFGAKVSLEQVAALRLPTEATSVALTRVANEFTVTNQVAQLMGQTAEKAWGVAGLASEKVRQQLINAAGGIDQLSNQAAFFSQNYLTESERLAPTIKYVTEQMAALGRANVTSREQFKQAVQSIDKTTEAGAKEWAQLMALQQAFAAVYPEIDNTIDAVKSAKDVLEERKGLQEQLDKLTMSSEQLRARERASLDESNRLLFDQITARQQIADAYAKESDALKSTVERLTQFKQTVLNFKDSLSLGDLSPLTPMQKLSEAQRQYEALLARAKAGDQDAQAQVTNAAQAYLQADQIIKASSDAYAADAAKVQSDLAELAQVAGAQASDAQKQLDAMHDQVGQLVALNDTAVGIQQAILNLGAAYGGGLKDSGTATQSAVIEQLYKSLLNRSAEADGMAFWMRAINNGLSYQQLMDSIKQSQEYQLLHGSHAGGLERVPFNGYRAELHEDEVVVDAASARAIRRYFGGAPARSGGQSDVVAELARNREELGKLRTDLERHTGAQIQSNLQAQSATAETIAGAIQSSSADAEFNRKNKEGAVVA